MDDVRQFHHLQFRQHDRRGNLAVGNRIARARDRSGVLIAVVLLVIAL